MAGGFSCGVFSCQAAVFGSETGIGPWTLGTTDTLAPVRWQHWRSDGVVQVGYDLLVLNGIEKKCSLLINLDTERFSILEKPVPEHIL